MTTVRATLLFATLLACSHAALAQSTGSHLLPMATPTIYDANQKPLGSLISFEDNGATGVVMFDLTDTDFIVLRLARDKASPNITWKHGPMYFAQPGCTGAAYTLGHDLLSDHTAAVGPGGVLFVGSNTTQAATDIAAVFDDSGCTPMVGRLFAAIPLAPSTYDLKSEYQTPFHIDNLHRSRAVAVAP